MYDINLHRLLLDSGITATLTDGSNATVAINGGDSFDGNLVIILVALLCGMRRRAALGGPFCSAMRQEVVRRAASPSASAAGLDKAALRQIPVAVYGAGVRIPTTDCSICLGELRQGERVGILSRCSHGFPVGCIDKWLVLHSPCPGRQPLVDTVT